MQGRNSTNLPICSPLEKPMIVPRPYQSRKVEKDQQSVDDKAGYINVKAGFLRTVLCAIIGSSVLSLQKSFTNMREARFPVREIISGSLLTTQPGRERRNQPPVTVCPDTGNFVMSRICCSASEREQKLNGRIYGNARFLPSTHFVFFLLNDIYHYNY